MTPAYAEIVRALAASCTFTLPWEFQLVSDLNAVRYHDKASPLKRGQRQALRALTRKYRLQLSPDIVAKAAELEEAERAGA